MPNSPNSQNTASMLLHCGGHCQRVGADRTWSGAEGYPMIPPRSGLRKRRNWAQNPFPAPPGPLTFQEG